MTNKKEGKVHHEYDVFCSHCGKSDLTEIPEVDISMWCKNCGTDIFPEYRLPPIDINKPATEEILERLVNGEIPEEFNEGQSNTTFWNWKQGPEYAEFLIWSGFNQLKAALADGATGNKVDNRDLYIFPSNPKYQLTKSLKANGWVQWHAVVTLRTREEAMELGIRYKAGRYPVHFWVGPEDQIILGKLVMEGKQEPSMNDCLKLGVIPHQCSFLK